MLLISFQYEVFSISYLNMCVQTTNQTWKKHTRNRALTACHTLQRNFYICPHVQPRHTAYKLRESVTDFGHRVRSQCLRTDMITLHESTVRHAKFATTRPENSHEAQMEMFQNLRIWHMHTSSLPEVSILLTRIQREVHHGDSLQQCCLRTDTPNTNHLSCIDSKHLCHKRYTDIDSSLHRRRRDNDVRQSWSRLDNSQAQYHPSYAQSYKFLA